MSRSQTFLKSCGSFRVVQGCFVRVFFCCFVCLFVFCFCFYLGGGGVVCLFFI